MKHETFDWGVCPSHLQKDGQHLYLSADKATEQAVYILKNQQHERVKRHQYTSRKI